MKLKPLILAALTVAAMHQGAWAGSIYARRSSGGKSVYADDTAKDAGDILTVIVSENSVVASETKRTLDKKTSRKAAMEGTVDLRDLMGARQGEHELNLPKIDASSSADSAFDGAGSFDSTRKVTDRITVAVEDVLPNGNLVILGTRYREVAGEKQVLQVSGIVRPSDIGFTNTVSSERVADFRLVVTIDGAEARATSPGWLTWILNVLNPF